MRESGYRAHLDVNLQNLQKMYLELHGWGPPTVYPRSCQGTLFTRRVFFPHQPPFFFLFKKHSREYKMFYLQHSQHQNAPFTLSTTPPPHHSTGTMRAQGHPMEETMTDEEATSAMESFSTTFQALEPRLHQMCPPEVVALSQRVFHQCTQAPANVNDTHELELCSEGLSIMTDALFKHATSLVRREDVVSV